MDKADKAKELKKSPFGIINKMEKERLVIEKIIDGVNKKTVASERDTILNDEFEKLLLKTKDPIQMWIRGAVLGELGHTNMETLYKNKAIELGYVVENKKTNENSMNGNRLKCVINMEFNTMDENIDVEYVKQHMTAAINSLFYKSFQHYSDMIIKDIAVTPIITESKTSVNENNMEYKQQFEYAPNEEVKWNIFEDENIPDVKKPEFNPTALRHLINDDAFLKFSYHNLSTGDEIKDLEMIYNTYVKNDDAMIKRLKQYESYTYKMLENAMQKDDIANTIMTLSSELGITTDDSEVMTWVNMTLSTNINKIMPEVKARFNMYTPDLKKELVDKFEKLRFEKMGTTFMKELRDSGLTIIDIKHDKIDIDKMSTAFGISKSAAEFIVFIIKKIFPTIYSVMHIGAENATKLLAISVEIILILGMNI